MLHNCYCSRPGLPLKLTAHIWVLIAQTGVQYKSLICKGKKKKRHLSASARDTYKQITTRDLTSRGCLKNQTIPHEKCLEQNLARSKHSINAGIIGRSKRMGALYPTPAPCFPSRSPGGPRCGPRPRSVETSRCFFPSKDE